jgi:hypothetical protein
MPFHFEFDSEQKILLLAYEGDVQGEDIGKANREMAKHVARLKPAAGIADLSAVKTFDVPSEALRTAAAQPSPYPDETTRYIIAPTDYLFGMSRMYQILANRPQEKLRVVRKRKDALAALGVREPKFERLE